MKLYLVQHAESKRKEEDHTRSLSDRGWKDIRKTANYAKEHLHIKVEQIVHSGKLRAKQTAEVLADHLNPPKAIITATNLEPLADPKAWKKRLVETTEDIMLVGHLPYLSKLLPICLLVMKTKK